ncbi:MAG TPA: aldo/keto reductase [Polyangiaceae bacterium]|nr:aldo/keto reductase [Polyangiaceae bacterium]
MSRIALGCQRAWGEPLLDAALDAGVDTFDTARAYGESERELGRFLRSRGVSVRVVTKGGMAGGWRPDGRARALREDLDASLEALGGVPIDTYLVHAPDPNMPWPTTMRALAKIRDDGLVKRIGVCNVTRKQLDEALDIAPIEVVQIALGAGSDVALRGGVVARCIARGIEVMAHSPLGGPKKAPKLGRDAVLGAIARRHDCSPQDVVIAALLDLHPSIVPVVGATRPETIRASARAASITLGEEDRAALDARFGFRDMLSPRLPSPTGAEVVLLMGLQGSGKSTRAAEYVARGYERLNRDERGGTLRGLHGELGARLARGAKTLVLDNTYVTRAQRHDVIAAAHAHGAIVRGVWTDVSLEDAQRNVIERMLAVHGRLLEPREMERMKDPSALPPHVLFHTLRVMDAPSDDEGFASLDVVRFTRTAAATRDTAMRFHVGWRPNATDAWVAEMRSNAEKHGAQFVYCAHDGGPPRCWCRPPLPGLLLAFAAAHDVDLARSVVTGSSTVHRKMAAGVGARFEEI